MLLVIIQDSCTKFGVRATCPVGYNCAPNSGTVTTPVSTATVPTTAPTATSVGSVVFTGNMSKGVSNADVKRLQQLLNTDSDTKVASEGVGSPGSETTMFGSLTERAVQKFQVKYNIANPGDAGYGTVGPMTRAMLQEVFGVTR